MLATHWEKRHTSTTMLYEHNVERKKWICFVRIEDWSACGLIKKY